MSYREPLKGVNLGGWLVLERWMTPSLFRGTRTVDEYGFMQTKGAAAKIEQHRHRFIREADFKWLADNGVEAVRLPVGYWALKSHPPYVHASKSLDFAVSMCEKYDLKLLIDLHAAPGSQNGQDHSGRVGAALWGVERQNQQKSIDTLVSIAKRYSTSPAIWGYQLLNEPKPGLWQWRLRRYYRQGYAELTNVTPEGTKIIFHDGFTSLLMSGVIRARASHPAVLDRHWYHFLQVGYRFLPLGWYFLKLRLAAIHLRLVGWYQPVIIGEWSGVIAGKKLKGLAKSERRRLQSEHIKRQLASYQSVSAWFYWSYKTESDGFWDFRSLVEKGIIKLSSKP